MKRRTKDLSLLKDLLFIPSPSGFEHKLAQFIKRELLKYLPSSRIQIDFQNNVTVTIKGSNPNKTVMIDAHLDEIGFIVNNIDREGLISVKYLGGGDKSILSARELSILTRNGVINAVVDRKHAHLVEDETSENIENIHEAQVDIGIRKRGQVQRYIKIGDPVVYRSSFNQLMEDYYTGYGFDDKAGVFILIQAIKKIVRAQSKPIPNLIFTFSAQEEIGGNKVNQLIKKYKPQLFVELDVTFATDYGDENLEKEAGKCELGKGLVLYKGVNTHTKSLTLLESTARRIKTKIQYQASTGMDGYTSNLITEYGVKALTLGIPLRNMHCPVEIINLKDLRTGSHLLARFLLNRKLGRVIEC